MMPEHPRRQRIDAINCEISEIIDEWIEPLTDASRDTVMNTSNHKMNLMVVLIKPNGNLYY